MEPLVRDRARRRVRRTLTGVTVVLLVVSTVGVLSASHGAAAPRSGPTPITLTFAGQVVGDQGLADFLDPYPPIEGGVARVYTVPTDARLVIESVYANLYERWPASASARSGATASINTAYDLGECAYPGYQRTYGIPLTDPVTYVGDPFESTRSGALLGPIYVEGGRSVNGDAFAPNSDSELFVHIVVHGYLEPSSSNPPAPVCGQP